MIQIAWLVGSAQKLLDESQTTETHYVWLEIGPIHFWTWVGLVFREFGRTVLCAYFGFALDPLLELLWQLPFHIIWICKQMVVSRLLPQPFDLGSVHFIGIE